MRRASGKAQKEYEAPRSDAGERGVLRAGIRLFTEPFALRPAMEALADLVRTYLAVDLVRLWLRRSGGKFSLSAQSGQVWEGSEDPEHLGSSEAFLDWLTNHPTPSVIPHSQEVGRLDDGRGRQPEGLGSLLAAPLSLDGKPLGVLVATQHRPRSFSAQEVATVDALATAAAVAVANQRHHQERDRRAAEAEELEQMARLVSTSRDVGAITGEVIRRGARLCAADRASVWLWDSRTRRTLPDLDPLSSLPGGDRRLLDGLGEAGLRSMPFIRRMVEDRLPQVLDDARRSDDVDPRWVEALSPRSLLGVPLTVRKEIVGSFLLDTVHHARPFSQRHVEIATNLAQQLSLALERTLLLQETHERLRETEAHLAISRTLSSTLELKPLLKEIARQAAQACEMDRCSFYLWEDERVVPVMSQFADGRGDEALWQSFQRMGRMSTEELPLFPEIIGRGRAVLIDNPADDPRVPPVMKSFNLKALLVVPLVRQQKVVGGMALDNTQREEPVTLAQMHLATAIASQVTLAVDNARLYNATEERLRHTQAHLEISRTLSSTLELKPLLKEITQQTASACGIESCSIHLSEGGWVVPMMSQYADGRVDEEGWEAFKSLRRRRVEELPYLTEMIRRGGPVIIDDPVEDPLWPPFMDRFRPTAVLVVPLIRQERLVGAMLLANTRDTHPISSEQVALATTLASQVALAVENARLYEETQRRLGETQARLKIARTLSSTLELKPLLKEITQQAARACDMERCSVQVWEEGRVVPLMAQYADGRVNTKHWKVFKGLRRRRVEELPYLTEMMRRRGPVIIDNPDQDPLWPEFLGPFENRSVLVVPLIRQETIVGAMLLTNNERAAPITPGQAALATTIASQVALAVDNVRLYDETQKRLAETQALLRLSQTLVGSLDRQEIARQTARELTRLLAADTSVFFEVDEAGHVWVRAGYHVPEEISRAPRRIPLTQRAAFMTVAAESGRPLATSDLAEDPRFHDLTLPALPIQARTLLYTPVVNQGRELGGLLSFWWNEEHEVTDDERRLASGIASQLVLVLEKIRHYDQARRALGDLKAAQDRLVRSERLRALAEMAGGVAHDFKNLLTAIRGRAQLLQRLIEAGKVTPEEVRSNLDVIELAALDGAETVRRLLDYTQARPHTEEPQEIDVNELLAHTKEVSSPRWKDEALARGFVIDVAVSPGEVPAVLGNPAELREVLLNLVFNSIEALPEGGTLTLSSGSDGDWVWVRVTDTGIGMSDDVKKRIFDPFFTTKGAGSSGLGLSSSYGIVHRHGGEIEVDSQPGGETAFTVRLPLAPVATS